MQDLNSLLSLLANDLTYNRLNYFTPYGFQKQFINAGKDYLQRAFCCGNRLGKTETGAYEMACHLTGRYPDWWDGYICEESGQEFIAVGITLKSTANILQKKLFGTNDARDTKLMGTGFIPLNDIIFDPMEKDGGRIVSCSIKHIDGGTNKLSFFCAGDEKKIMGMTLKGCWIDESDRTQCGPLYDQCNTRVMTTNGFVLQTFTPENGIDDVVQKFLDAQDEEDSSLYLQINSMYDAHTNVGGHITDAMIKRIKDGSPEFMWDCRINGIPSAGAGAVFSIKDSEITEEILYDLPQHWKLIAGVDFGMVKDPSVIVYSAYDPDEKLFYLVDEVYLDDDRSPRAIANSILSGKYPNVTVIVPHDGGLNSDDPQAKGKLLIEYGCNVHRNVFTNPVDVRLGIDEIRPYGKMTHNSIQAGLIEMKRRFEEGSLKVNVNMKHFLKEKRTYFYKQLNNGGYQPVGDDHVIDASRYAVMSLIGGLGSTVYESLAKSNKKRIYNTMGGFNF